MAVCLRCEFPTKYTRLRVGRSPPAGPGGGGSGSPGGPGASAAPAHGVWCQCLGMALPLSSSPPTFNPLRRCPGHGGGPGPRELAGNRLQVSVGKPGLGLLVRGATMGAKILKWKHGGGCSAADSPPLRFTRILLSPPRPWPVRSPSEAKCFRGS